MCRQALVSHSYASETQAHLQDVQSCGACDNCQLQTTHEIKTIEITAAATNLVLIVKQLMPKANKDHLSQVFRGSYTARIREKRHEKLMGFGSGMQFSSYEVERIIHHMLSCGFLTTKLTRNFRCDTVTGYLFPGRSFTNMHLSLDFARLIPSKEAGSEAPQTQDAIDKRSVYTSLLNLRKSIAASLPGGVPPFYVCLTSMIKTLATKLPQTLQELQSIWTSPMADLYGEQFLQKIKEVQQASSSLQPKLFDRLLVTRQLMAESYNVLPPLICSDMVLRKLSSSMPTNESELRLYWVGPLAEKYGPQFLQSINDLIAENTTTPRSAIAPVLGVRAATDFHRTNPPPKISRPRSNLTLVTLSPTSL
jgi:superfamily II DNA helicase RecQ